MNLPLYIDVPEPCMQYLLATNNHNENVCVCSDWRLTAKSKPEPHLSIITRGRETKILFWNNYAVYSISGLQTSRQLEQDMLYSWNNPQIEYSMARVTGINTFLNTQQVTEAIIQNLYPRDSIIIPTTFSSKDKQSPRTNRSPYSLEIPVKDITPNVLPTGMMNLFSMQSVFTQYNPVKLFPLLPELPPNQPDLITLTVTPNGDGWVFTMPTNENDIRFRKYYIRKPISDTAQAVLWNPVWRKGTTVLSIREQLNGVTFDSHFTSNDYRG